MSSVNMEPLNKVKSAYLLLFGLLFPALMHAQILEPVKWEFSSLKETGDEYILVFKASIDEGWHLYSQHLEGEGPVPTSFTFHDSTGAFSLKGETEETGRSEEAFDPIFEMNLKWFFSKAVFRQRIKLHRPEAKVTGFLTFMACDDKQCLPPEDVEFSFDLKAEGKTVETTSGTPPPVSAQADETPRTPWGIFWAGFIGGLIALLTPCVFPIIPLTVSFFTKQSATRSKGIFNGVVYALSIIIIYIGPMFLITKLLGADALNAMASNIFFNLAFFLIFLVFAISFFGAFEITLPSSLVSTADKYSSKGGLIGIFFMAFTLALVSFSCTGPIIGTLLVEAAVRDAYLGPLAGLAGFSIALALPFGLFAAFPGWMNSLPKSGGWLNTVKVSLGFIELALALKFLSNVDLAYHWGLLKREIFLGLWIVITTMWGFYLLGKLRFIYDNELPYISIPRLMASIVIFSFAAYMIPGIWGAPLKALAGLEPPIFYTIWENKSPAQSKSENKRTTASFHCPHDINCFHDYDEGLAYARKNGKPLMLDFTGWTCVNCRKMEVNVWIDPGILKMISEDYVLVSLYVDDKESLPTDKVYTSKVNKGKKIKTVGAKWHDMQTERYQRNTQPWYVLLDHDESELVPGKGYTPDADEYTAFLESGLAEFRRRHAGSGGASE